MSRFAKGDVAAYVIEPRARRNPTFQVQAPHGDALQIGDEEYRAR
jgi:hypothetical protein